MEILSIIFLACVLCKLAYEAIVSAVRYIRRNDMHPASWCLELFRDRSAFLKFTLPFITFIVCYFAGQADTDAISTKTQIVLLFIALACVVYFAGWLVWYFWLKDWWNRK